MRKTEAENPNVFGFMIRQLTARDAGCQIGCGHERTGLRNSALGIGMAARIDDRGMSMEDRKQE